jgi:hypothetical protein
LSQVKRSTGISGQIVRKSGGHAQRIADGTLISMAAKDRWDWRSPRFTGNFWTFCPEIRTVGTSVDGRWSPLTCSRLKGGRVARPSARVVLKSS